MHHRTLKEGGLNLFLPLTLSSLLQFSVFDSLEIFGNFCFGNAWAMSEKV